ncbi:DUF2490 domain-containing protein [Erythrobacter sp. NE805]|uniref:DUF2490 domain-containing protein n=1 Tax=Erythrobacter sp. NE805 TaxID=3389875 RepID=UPI00396B2B56
MTLGPIRCAMLLAALAAAWQPSKASATEEDTQFWLNTFVTGPIGKTTTLTVDATQRWRSDRVGPDQQTIRVLIDEQVARRARIGGAVMLFDTDGLTEVRLHQQAVFSLGRIDARTRVEERFFDGADRMEVRLRQRFTYNQPIAEKWRATAGVEWLGIMRSRNRGEGASTEQWRFQTSVVHSLDKRFDVAALYWMVAFPRGDRPARVSHIPQVAFTVRF